MAAATTLPDDFALEYDLMQLVDEHGAFASSGAAAAADSVAVAVPASLDVDELLSGRASGGLEGLLDAGDVRATAGVSAGEPAPKNLASDDCLLSLTADVDAAAGDAALSELLLSGEELLSAMERSLDLDVLAVGASSASSSSSSSSSSPRHEPDADGLTDADVLSSPCPSSCPSGVDSPKPCDPDDLDCLLMQDDNMWDAPAPAPTPAAMQQLQRQQQMIMALHQQQQRAMGVPAAPMAPMPIFHGMDLVPDMAAVMPSYAQQAQAQPQLLAGATPMAIDLTGDGGEATEADVEDDDEDDEDEELQAKNDAELLQKEAKYLEAQYDYLVSRAKSSRPPRANVKAKSKRGRGRGGASGDKEALVKSTKDGKLLNELVAQQQVYLDNFKAMLSFAPVNDVRLALMTPMESYIHLGRDFAERRRTILALREEKLDMTYKYIEQKAAGLNLDQPYQYSDMFEKFGKNYCVNFAISKYEDVGVLAVAGAIYEQIAGKDEDLTSKMGCLTIRESYDQIRCNFMHQRIVSSMQWDDSEAVKMPDIESNAIFYNRFDDNVAVMATDYIDQDDLHPYQGSERIRKDVSSGVVLTGHVDANGRNYVIMKRFLMAKFHMYPHKIPQEQQDRFFAKMPLCHDKMKTLIVDKLARKGDDGPFAACTNAAHLAQQQQQH